MVFIVSTQVKNRIGPFKLMETISILMRAHHQNYRQIFSHKKRELCFFSDYKFQVFDSYWAAYSFFKFYLSKNLKKDFKYAVLLLSFMKFWRKRTEFDNSVRLSAKLIMIFSVDTSVRLKPSFHPIEKKTLSKKVTYKGFKVIKRTNKSFRFMNHRHSRHQTKYYSELKITLLH